MSGGRIPRRAAALLVMALLVAPASSSAQLGLNGRPSHSPTISERRADIECGDLHGDGDLHCRIEVSYVVCLPPEAEPIRMSSGAGSEIDGEETTHATLLPGQPRRVHQIREAVVPATTSEALWVRSREPLHRFLFPDGMTARHLLMGDEYDALPPRRYALRTQLFSYVDEARFEGPLVVRIQLRDGLEGGYDGRTVDRIGNEFEVHRGDGAEGAFRIGGPVVGLGVLDEPQRFRGRLGYQIGVGDFFVAQLSAETDFQSDFTFALTAGGLTPGLLFIMFPSLEVSVGAVLRLAPDVRGGLRLVAGANFYPFGVQVSVDYWPEDDSVDLSALATFSL